MASCRFCNTSGSNMRQCQSCNQVWCHQCLTWHPERVPHYPPKPNADNQCPFCATYNEIQQAPSSMSERLCFNHLLEATARFFDWHWNKDAIGDDPPQWVHWPEFRGSAPNYQLGGCYALFEGASLKYIGLGASEGGGLYPEHGISRRLMSHVLRIDRERGAEWLKPRTGWESIDSIYTIGFPSKLVHLAHALETFLIREFKGKLRNARV